MSLIDLTNLVREISFSDELRLEDIPDIGLYMDQMIQLIDGKLASKAGQQKGFLTRTMINNYTKAGLLMPPINKRYYREHIILLLLIYYLKDILSLNNIKTLLSPILNDIATREDDLIPLEQIYSTFVDLKQQELDTYFAEPLEKYNYISSSTQNLERDKQQTAEMFLTVLMLVARSNAQKQLAEQIIDKYFRPE